MQHALFIGDFEVSIDHKGRLLLPIELRRSIDTARHGEGFYLVVGINRKPWLWPERIYEEIVSKSENDLMPDEDMLAFDQVYFSGASKVEPDKAGRILIPDKILRRTKTSREITLIGARNHLELWNREDWERKFEENLDRMPDLAKRAREARKQP